jgi:hypothetical protein
METVDLEISQISDYLDFNRNLANVERDVNEAKNIHKSLISAGSKNPVKEPDPLRIEPARKTKSIAVV